MHIFLVEHTSQSDCRSDNKTRQKDKGDKRKGQGRGREEQTANLFTKHRWTRRKRRSRIQHRTTKEGKHPRSGEIHGQANHS